MIFPLCVETADVMLPPLVTCRFYLKRTIFFVMTVLSASKR